MLDQPNEDSDRRLGKHLVSLYYDDDTQLRAQQMRAGNVDQVLESTYYFFELFFEFFLLQNYDIQIFMCIFTIFCIIVYIII